jgi:hypothetical protein
MRLLIASLALLISQSSSASVKTYQVTGPVLDVTDDTVTVQKGKEKWEIQKDANTKALAGFKKGDKVTISYFMTAKQIEPKTDSKK